jgi:hypothetical protein
VFLDVLDSIAEFKRLVAVGRMAAAKARGVKLGRSQTVSREAVKRLRARGLSGRAIATDRERVRDSSGNWLTTRDNNLGVCRGRTDNIVPLSVALSSKGSERTGREPGAFCKRVLWPLIV